MIEDEVLLNAAICGKNHIIECIEKSIMEIAKIEEELKFFRQKLYDYDLVIKNLSEKKHD